MSSAGLNMLKYGSFSGAEKLKWGNRTSKVSMLFLLVCHSHESKRSDGALCLLKYFRARGVIFCVCFKVCKQNISSLPGVLCVSGSGKSPCAYRTLLYTPEFPKHAVTNWACDPMSWCRVIFFFSFLYGDLRCGWWLEWDNMLAFSALCQLKDMQPHRLL